MAQGSSRRGLAVFGFAALCSIAGASAYAASIVGSSHDLTAMSPRMIHQGNIYNNYNDICIYCHTVQSGTNNFDAWNRPGSTASYTLYQSPTFKSSVSAPDATSSSSLCLSCHDGTIAVDNIITRPGTYTAAPMHAAMNNNSANCGMCHQAFPVTSGVAESAFARVRHGFIGTDLSNDHPVNMTYDNLLDPKLRPISTVTASGLKLDSQNRVQCYSCHDPHVPNEKAFLRISNMNSALCTTCHTK